MHVVCCKCENCWPGIRIPHLNGLQCGVTEGFFRGPAPVPECMVLGFNWRFRTTPRLHSFLRLMEVWSENVLLGLKLLFESTQRPHFFFKLDGEETAKP